MSQIAPAAFVMAVAKPQDPGPGRGTGRDGVNRQSTCKPDRGSRGTHQAGTARLRGFIERIEATPCKSRTRPVRPVGFSGHSIRPSFDHWLGMYRVRTSRTGINRRQDLWAEFYLRGNVSHRAVPRSSERSKGFG